MYSAVLLDSEHKFFICIQKYCTSGGIPAPHLATARQEN